MDQAFRSLFLGRRFWYPHFLHRVARIALRALQRMQIFTFNVRASASGNLAILIHHFPVLYKMSYSVLTVTYLLIPFRRREAIP
jgi:hypothetical protein